ncbi:MAG: hypothetical protein NT068_04215 [Candidatus Nomurabacteria bacterium]|nr:hypothetical protein [Candidatus Nomurabacteria bacterium]
MKNNKSIIESFLEELMKSNIRYGGVAVNLLGLPVFNKKYSKTSFANAISRMKKNKFIENDGEFLKITPKGKEYIKKKQDSLQVFSNTFKKDTPKNLIVMFDIPEGKKGEREWFRFHLKKFNYVMIQRSVWVGPSPLPKNFMNYVESIKLKDCIKTFKLAKAYKIEK